MDKENPEKNSDNIKKYRFYRKPSIKRKGPEIKHTKTSLARLLKANPELKYELDQQHDKIDKSKNNQYRSKPSKPIPSGNVQILSNLRVPSLSNLRLSGSDFSKELLSSTLLEDDDIFLTDKNTKHQPQKNKASSRNNEKENKQPKRRSLSSQFVENKKKEMRTMVKNYNSNKSLKRRSRSLESAAPTTCYTIDEEYPLYSSVAHSEKNLAEATFRFVDAEFDEENKENIDMGLVESESYEALFPKI